VVEIAMPIVTFRKIGGERSKTGAGNIWR